MAAILKTFAGLNFYTRTCFIDYYHISFKKSHQTLRPRSCRVNQNFDISWILDLGLGIPIFLILLKNIDCGYSLEPPRRGGSNMYPQSMF